MAKPDLRVAIAVVGVLLLPLTAASAQRPEPNDRVLPDYDIRLLTPPIVTPLGPEAEALRDQLRGERGDLRVRPHPWQAGLRTLSAHGRPLSSARPGPPEQAARSFLTRYHRLLGLDPRDMTTLVKTREYRSHDERVVHLLFKQTIDGLDVFGGVVQVHLRGDGAVLGLANTAIAGGSLPSPRVAASAAARVAIENVRPELAFDPSPLGAEAGPDRHTRFAHGPFQSDIDAHLVVFPTGAGPRVAWQITLEPTGLPQKYDVLVDAVTGDMLYRRNRVRYIEGVGHVLQGDATASRDPRLSDAMPVGASPAGAGDPPGGCPPVANFNSRSLTAPFLDRATVLGSSGHLDGNNVHVFRGAPDAEGALGTAQPDGWHFDYTFGTADSVETQLFFINNFLHDFFYDLGFDEAAGNFQASNLGRGGLEGDALAAVARAAGRNNASFEPNPDGQRSVMSMFLWDGHGCWASDVDGDGAVDLDGDLDSDIVIHEFHHGVSNRLNTQFTGIEADAMGEGGSDFFAYSINNNPVLAEYASPPNGIRQINAKTYGDWFCLSIFGLVICEPHDNGEIFANTLWDLRERFRADNVDGSDQAAVHEVHQLYVDALKLSPPSPTMLDMRDAVLDADVIRRPSTDPGGSVNHCRIWDVFAARGLGAAARDTDDTGTGSVVEDFSVAPECPAPPPPAVVTVTASPSTATEAGPTAAVFHIARTGDASHAITVLFTTSGTATSGADYAPLGTSVTLQAGAASADLLVTPIDDAVVEANETVVLTITDDIGYHPGSPSSATVTIVSDDVAPDLTVSSLTAPFYAGAGAPLAVTATVANTGTGAATASAVRYHLSTNISLDGSDIALGTSPITALSPGTSQAISATVTIPAGTMTGIYYVLAQADADNTNTEISETNNVRFVQIRVGPDLTITAVGAPAIAGAGSALVVTDTTKNAGAGATPASVTRFYLSSNPVFDAGDLPLGSRAVPTLGAGEANAGSTTVTVPAGTATGTYYLFAVADASNSVDEVNEANNTAWVVVRVGPDLVIASETVTGTPTPGTSVTVSDTTKNQGGSASAGSTTRFYLSSDTAVDGSDTLLGDRAIGALAAGGSSSGTTPVTIPPGTATGTYYVLAVADGLAANVETNETNNVASVQVRIGPDLVSSVTGPATSAPGAAMTVTDTTRNQGNAGAGSSSTRFWLSADASLDASDVALGARAVSALGVSQSSTGSTTLVLPATLTTGTYYVIAQADGNAEVVETLETNNTSWLQFRIGPDLAIAGVTVGGTLQSGGTFSVTDTTKNQGSGAAGASMTRFYFSTNPTLDQTDPLLGSRPVPALDAGVAQSGTTALTLPTSLAGGPYYLLVVADGDGTVAETSESNNVWPAVIRVGPDLTISAMNVQRSLTAGASATLTDITRNQGAPAPPTTTRFYLTADFVLDASDVALGSRAVAALGGGGTSTGSTVVTIPAGVSPGHYYLLAVADGDGAVAEAVETNNSSFLAIDVTP
jgi:subtilase family serine protease